MLNEKQQLYLFDECKESVEYGITSKFGSKEITLTEPYFAPNSAWLIAPECAQLAACTFNRAVAVYYTANTSVTFLFILPNPNRKKVAIPLILHAVSGNHWVSLFLKRSLSFRLPPILEVYHSLMKKYKLDNHYKTFWNCKLSFRKVQQHQEKQKASKSASTNARIDDDDFQ